MSIAAVDVEGVSKRFRHRRTSGPRIARVSRVPARSRVFWALRDVSFEVSKGRTTGIVGPNGAGKSTLLRLIAGVGRPDAGRIRTSGQLSAIFELGTGFHPELTGRESAVLGGIVGGLSRREVRERLDDIIAFAELDGFIDDPIRTYSSGMVARLAFALATSMDAEILLVDELLAVGDLAFQERCAQRIREFRQAGATLLLVSHHPSSLAAMCDDVIWLQGGRLVARGAPHEIAQRYEAAMAERGRRITPLHVPEDFTPEGVPLRVHENRFGTQEAQITSVKVVDDAGRPLRQIRSGDALSMDIALNVPDDIGPVRIGVRLVRDDGIVCLDSSTRLTSEPGSRSREALLDVPRLDLLGGGYAFDVGLYSDEWERPYDFHWRAYRLRVVGDAGGVGVLGIPIRWTVGAQRNTQEA